MSTVATARAYGAGCSAPSCKLEATVIGIDIGKNSFQVVGQDRRGAIVLRQKWSAWAGGSAAGQLPACLIEMRPASVRIISAASSRDDSAAYPYPSLMPYSS